MPSLPPSRPGERPGHPTRSSSAGKDEVVPDLVANCRHVKPVVIDGATHFFSTSTGGKAADAESPGF